MYPGAERRKLAVVHVATGMELHLRPVIAVRRPHRAHDGEAIHVLPDARKIVADLDAALAALMEAVLHWVKHKLRIAVGVFRDQSLDGKLLRIQSVGEG